MTERSDPGRVEFTPSGKPVTHGGTGNAYTNHGCRCVECKAANTARVKRRRVERAAEVQEGGGDLGFVHGNSAYSNWGCRCEVCSAAAVARMRRDYESRKRRVADAPHGTVSGYASWGCRCELCKTARRAAEETEES